MAQNKAIYRSRPVDDLEDLSWFEQD